jgi:uncharacterized protein with PQ loop repeat
VSPLELLVTTSFTVLTIAIVIPQAWRLAKTRNPAGLSAAGLLNGSVGYLAWVGYLTYQQHWLAMAATALAGVVWIATAAYVVTHRGATRAAVTSTVAWAGTLGALALISVPVFGVALSFGAVWSGIPSVREAWRAGEISGISTPTWALYVAESLAWLAWGVVEHDFVVGLYGVLATGIGTAVIAAVVVRVEARRIPALVDDAAEALDSVLDSALHPEPATA